MNYARFVNPAPLRSTHSPNPKTRCTAIAAIGDVDPITYGGGFVLKCKDPGQPAYYIIEYVHEEEDEGAVRTLYSEHVPEGDVWEWYNWANISHISSTTGLDEEELRGWGRAASPPVAKAAAVQAIAEYYGWHELDQYPLRLTDSQLRTRWRAALRKKL